VCLILSAGCVLGQDPQTGGQSTAPQVPPASISKGGTSSSAQAPDNSETGRRFTAGVTLSVLGFSMIPGKTSSTTDAAGTTTDNQTTGASSRIGYGITAQYRITEHFSVDVAAIYRRIGYQFTSTVTGTTTSILNGITTSTTTTTSTHDDTRSRLFDIPLELRYYSSARRPDGPRWFLEAGGAWRVATGLRTTTDTTDASGVNTCCTTTPTTPAHHSSIGMVGGAGVQLIDPLGIHVVPEVRYTRWVDPIFNNLTTNTNQNQLDASLSLTF
jgi:hypothetical protein